jgi:hypothetical protein
VVLSLITAKFNGSHNPSLAYILEADRIQNTASSRSSVVAFVSAAAVIDSIAVETCLESHYQAAGLSSGFGPMNMSWGLIVIGNNHGICKLVVSCPEKQTFREHFVCFA